MRQLTQARPAFEALRSLAPIQRRVAFDPIELPRRYREASDIEVAGLLSASLAYGRVELFKPKVEGLLSQMGPSPARFVRELDLPGAKRLLDGFVYRFNVASDLAVLLLGMGKILREHGSLEECFVAGLTHGASIQRALDLFVDQLRAAAKLPIQRALGPFRGLDHLLPSPRRGGSSKRLCLFLRWMVRGPDEVDFGIWRRVSPSALVVPLDTHLHRVALRLDLTRRKSSGWKTATEITTSLKMIDSADPVKYDFFLCHLGMSGACPIRASAASCGACPLQTICPTGQRVMRKPPGRIRRQTRLALPKGPSTTSAGR